MIKNEIKILKDPKILVAFKWQSSLKSPYGILWRGVLEPLVNVCTDLKISKESNVNLIQ